MWRVEEQLLDLRVVSADDVVVEGLSVEVECGLRGGGSSGGHWCCVVSE